MVLMLHKELTELKAKVGSGTTDVSASNPDNLRDSCNIASNEVNNGYCELYISNPLTLVAKGIVCNNEDSTLHNLPIPPNHKRVKVDIVVVGDALLPVPIDTAEMTLLTVSDALGTFVAWPSNLINVKKARSRHGGKSQRSPSKAPKKDVSRRVDKGKENQSQPSTSNAPKKSVSRQVDKGKDIQSQPLSRKEFIAHIKNHAATMTNGDLITVLIDPDILGVDCIIPISQDELREVYDHKWASQISITIYIRYLFYEIMSPMDLTEKFFFLCPERTHLLNLSFRKDTTKENVAKMKKNIKVNKEAVKAYINQRLALAHESNCDSLFLAPTLLGKHWILLVVDPKRNRIFYLDSCHGDPNNHLKMKAMFESCLTTYWGSNEVRARDGNVKNKTQWIVIKCPRQPNNDDCGYYVMKFMRDIITHHQTEIPVNYFPGMSVGAPFSDDQLTELRGEWCHHVAGLINENRNSCNFG